MNIKSFKQFINENLKTIPILYHGTTKSSALNIIENGWSPNSGVSKANQGQLKYLYLTNVKENAEWFAEENGGDTVIKVSNVPLSALKVDPEDGTFDSVEEELAMKNGLPGSVVLFTQLDKSHFEIL